MGGTAPPSLTLPRKGGRGMCISRLKGGPGEALGPPFRAADFRRAVLASQGGRGLARVWS